MISGASKEHARAALQAAFGDPNRAFEYLASGFTGAGAGAGMGGFGQMAGMDAGMMDEEYGDEEDEGSSDFGNPFEAFASNPGFQELRARILQSPQFYQEFM